MLPAPNACGEAAVVSGLSVYAVSSLAEAVPDPERFRRRGRSRLPHPCVPRRATRPISPTSRGQLLARRALEIASAGGHNLLLVGPALAPARR